MEVEGEDGSTLLLESRSTTLFGRGSGFTSDDRTVSRRHILFDVIPETEFRVSFEVIGRNPIWLRSGVDGEIRTFRRFSKGEMAPGYSFCVAAKSPIWFNLKKADEFAQKDEQISWNKSEIGSSSRNGFDFEGVDVRGIDPVKEFGFIVMGHEFDSYARRIVHDPKKWKWFLEETRENSDDDADQEFGKKKRRGMTKKRKNAAEEDDDDWRGDSEDDEQMIVQARKAGRPKYRTRSKDVNKSGSKSSIQKKTSILTQDEETEAYEDEDDETLGGFIVDEDGVDEEQTNRDEEDEEEEFTDEEDND